MSETKQPWTPGPWEVRDRLGRIYVTDPDGIVIAQITSGNHADARLFVAAPPMAEALARFVLGYDDALRRRGDKTAPADPPVIASARAALEACGWRGGGR